LPHCECRPPDPSPLDRHGHRPGPGPAHPLALEFFGDKSPLAAAGSPRGGAREALMPCALYLSAALPRTKFPVGTATSTGSSRRAARRRTSSRITLAAGSPSGRIRCPGWRASFAEIQCLAEKAAAETGCRSKTSEPGPGVTTFRRNCVLEELFIPLFEERGRSDPAKLRESYGSTDPGQCLLGRPDDRADDQGQRFPHPHRGLRPGLP